MNTERVQLQDLPSLSVRILDMNDNTCGTGIIVSEDGKIVTCVHVVEVALGVHLLQEAIDRKIGVMVQQGVGTERRNTLVSAYLFDYEDDVVLLQIIDGQLPLPKAQVAILGAGEHSRMKRFQSYGFRQLDPYHSGYAEGKIYGPVESPPDKKLQFRPLQIRSDEIDRGMSGAAVLDMDRNLVVGIIMQTYHPPRGSMKDYATAWAVDASILTLPPFNLSLRETSLPLKRDTLFHMDSVAIHTTAIINPENDLDSAPLPLPEWVGRERFLEELSDDWMNKERKVTCVVGIGGEGKTSLVRHWVEELLADGSQLQPDGVFWWDFYTSPNPASFFDAALEFVWNGRVPPGMTPEEIDAAPEQFLAGFLGAQRYLFVLDGLEILQDESSDHFGLLKDERFGKFLRYFATLTHDSHCIITSRASVLDIMKYTTCVQRVLTPLSIEDGVTLLRNLDISGADSQLTNAVEKWGGYALALNLLGWLLKNHYGGDIAAADKLPLWSQITSSEQRVQSMLDYYHRILTSSERTLLIFFSAFRAPISNDIFAEFVDSNAYSQDTWLAQIATSDAESLLLHLVESYKMLRENEQHEYVFHPLFRSYYGDQFAALPPQTIHEVYTAIAIYYSEKAKKYEDQANEAFATMGVETNPLHWSRMSYAINRAGYMGMRWGQRAASAGDWRVKVFGTIVGAAAGAAVGGVIGLLSDSQVWESSAKSIDQFRQGRRYRQRAQYCQREVDYYQELRESVSL